MYNNMYKIQSDSSLVRNYTGVEKPNRISVSMCQSCNASTRKRCKNIETLTLRSKYRKLFSKIEYIFPSTVNKCCY